jgi:LmbE family N-acetylglucosaminyl deacetylase
MRARGSIRPAARTLHGMESMKRILIIGAHPDDCEYFAGGTAALWRARGDLVRFVSVTNGDAGHFSMLRGELGVRRRAEARRAGAVAGIEYTVLGHHDGELQPTIEAREEIIRLIRECSPDLVLTHRPYDYHPDHRYTAALVLDAAYLVTVPLLCPETRHLDRNPVFGYLWDDFQRPAPFRADVVVPVDAVMETKWRMLDAHESQFYEWLPFNLGWDLSRIPSDPSTRLAWIAERFEEPLARVATKIRAARPEYRGAEIADGVVFVEAFEIGEHGRRPSAAEIAELFPCAEEHDRQS